MRNRNGPPAVGGAGPAVAALAAEQHGVVSVAQLRALGLDKFAVARRITAGWLHPVHRGVYAVGHGSLSRRAGYMASVLACGPGTALSHRAAGNDWDLRQSDGRPEVTAPRARRGPPGVIVHRCRSLHPAEVTRLHGIPITSVARTLLDLAAVLPPRELDRAIDRAERLELFDLHDVERVLARANGRRGARALRLAIAAWRATGTRSELEERFRELVLPSGVSLPLFNVLVHGERDTHEVDAFWPDRRLVVQLDGFAYHRTRRDRERDASADADLELAGYRVLRLTWGDVTVHSRRTLRRLPAA